MAQITLTDASNISWDLSTDFSSKLLATSGVGDTRSLQNSLLSSAISGENYQMIFIQDNVGGRQISFGNNYKVIGSFNLDPNSVTVVTIVYDSLKTIVVLTNSKEDFNSANVKALYEANANTNEFNDSEKAKLDGLSETFHLGLAFGNEVTDISVGTDKLTFQMPNFDTTLTDVSVNVKTAPTGSVATFDLNEAGTSVLSTKITIDAGKKTSVTASTPPVISESAIQANAIMTVDIDGVGSTVSGVAPKLWIYYTIPKIAPNVSNMFPFKFTVNTAESGTSGVDQFTIPVGAGTFLYNVTTEDGYSATGLTGDHTITFPSGTGTHNVEITGSFPAIRFMVGGDRNKFSTIENFGIYGINSTNQDGAFYSCSNLLINATDIGHLENVTNFAQFFRSCGKITSLPRFNTSSATTLAIAFFGCGQLKEFPLINTSNVTNLNFTFTSCGSLTEFPLIDVSSVTNFSQAWFNCNSMISFPAINPISSTSFNKTWGNCASLETFSANVFNNSISTSNYTEAFLNTKLTEQSIDNILVSISSNGVSNGTFAQSGGETPSATGIAAKDSLVAKGWTIVYTT